MGLWLAHAHDDRQRGDGPNETVADEARDLAARRPIWPGGMLLIGGAKHEPGNPIRIVIFRL